MGNYVWKSKSGKKLLMREMSKEELQEALSIAEKHHIVAENSVQRALKNSKVFMDKALELRKIAKERGIEIKSLHEQHPGKYQMIQNAYKLLEGE